MMLFSYIMLVLGAIGFLTKPAIFRGINGVLLLISKPLDQVRKGL